MGPIRGKARQSGETAETTFSFCEHCAAQMPANAKYCMDCGYERRVGGPTDGADQTASGIIVVSTGGRRPVSHALNDPTEEVMVIDDQGRASFVVKPAEPPVIEPDLAEVPPVSGRRRGVVTAAAAGVVALGVVAALAVLLWPDSETPVDVNAELVAGSEAVTDSMRAFSRADVLDDLSAASATATETSLAYDQQLAVVAEAGDEDLRAAATEVLEAERATLGAFAFTFANYRARDFSNWENRQQTMQARLNRLSRAQQDLAALGNEEITARVDIAAAEEVLTDLGRLVRDKQDQYQQWRQARTLALGSQAAASFGLQGYAEPARAVMAEYSALRTELADWTVQIDQRFVSVTEGYLVLAQAATDRRDIRNRFASLQVPPSLAAAHSSLLSVVDEGIAGVESAVEGLNVYVNDPYYLYWDARNTPGWITFTTASDRITGQFDTARAAWDAALTAEQNRIQNTPVPPPPEL